MKITEIFIFNRDFFRTPATPGMALYTTLFEVHLLNYKLNDLTKAHFLFDRCLGQEARNLRNILTFTHPCVTMGAPKTDRITQINEKMLYCLALNNYEKFFYNNQNEGNTMSSQEQLITNNLLCVRTFDDLIAVRALTGIMRLNEHHVINNLSTFLKEGNRTIRPITDDEFESVIDDLIALDYRVEVRTNTTGSRTLNAYKLDGEICLTAVVLMYESNKLRYFIYTEVSRRTEIKELDTLLSQFDQEDPIVINYVTGFADGGAIVSHRVIDMDYNRPEDYYYPFIEGGIDKLTNDFVNSNSNLLLLVGPRGTGKTSLLREFARRYKLGKTFQMCGDKVILDRNFDSYLADLPEKSLIIIEDADNILGHRTDGNTSLSMLLNELDGISNKGSKYVITTNLENLKSIDPAVLRVGRCHDIIQFRDLTSSEANYVADKLEINTQFTSSTSLAEIFNGKNKNVGGTVGFRLE